MNISKFDSGLLNSYMYIIEEDGHAIVIDPCKNITPAIGLTTDLLIITHEHYDHISGVNEWKSAVNVPLLCSKSCSENIKDSKKNMSRYFEAFCMMQTWVPLGQVKVKSIEYSCEADIIFEKETSFEWQGHILNLFEVPGHSKGSIGIGIDNKDFFLGDSLFNQYDIELRFPGGSIYEWETIGKKRIDTIPDGAMIWPGHFENFKIQKHVSNK